MLQGGAWRHGRDQEERAKEGGEGGRRWDGEESGGMTASKETQKTIMTPVIHPTFIINHKDRSVYIHSMLQ